MSRESSEWSCSSRLFFVRINLLFLVKFFILTILTINTCTTFPTFAPSSTNDDIRVTPVTSLVSPSTPSSSEFNHRIFSPNFNTAKGWTSVFIPSEFHFLNRRAQSNNNNNNNNNFTPQNQHQHLSHHLPHHLQQGQPQPQIFNSPASFESNFNLLQGEQKQVEESLEDTFLNAIDDISRGLRCHPAYTSRDVVQTSHQRYLMLPSKVRRVGDRVASIWREKGKDTSMRVSLLSSILSEYEPHRDGYKFLRNSIDQLVAQDGSFFRARVAWFKQSSNNKAISRSNLIADYLIQLEPKRRTSSESYNTSITISEPWLRPSTNVGKKSQFYERLLREASVHIGSSAFSREELIFADWSPIYYSCELKKWLMSFSTLIIGEVAQNVYTIRGLISVDVDVSATDFDQCQGESTFSTSTTTATATTTTVGDHQAVTVAGGVVVNLPGSHKCEEKSSLCIFHPGYGWRRGGYKCICKSNFYSTTASMDEGGDRAYFNGSMVESAWKHKQRHRGLAYELIYTCQACHGSCSNGCYDDTPCITGSNWFTSGSFIVTLTISIFVLSFLVYFLLSRRAKYRREFN